MTLAIKQTVDFAFNTLSLHRIEANVMPHNIASLKVLEKNNFNKEGLAKKYLKINGKWEDHIHMVLLNELID
jgi:ribosomal-protein-alanine N-acetyltransferase